MPRPMPYTAVTTRHRAPRSALVLETDPSPTTGEHVLISVNPKAGRRSAARRVDRLTELLGQRGFRVRIYTDLAEVSGEANRLHGAGELRALVGVGGDGTAAELANRTQEGVPLTLLAAGTANLLSKHLGLNGKPEQLCQAIADGTLLRLDAGRAAGRLFLVMVGCGFDADVVHRVHSHRENNPRGAHIGYTSYLKPIVESIRNYGYPEIQVYCDEPSGQPAEDRSSPVTARWVFVCNLPRYGWGLRVAPEAVATDGLLDVCTFRRGSLFHGLRYTAAVQFGGWHRRMGECVMRQARRLRITSEEPVAYQLDGDPGGVLPLDAEVLPERVTVVVPAQQ
jgi:diacylglycerol kinase (ATP)